MTLEHGISPLHEAPVALLWEGLTADLILAGKIPPVESWVDSSGTLERIGAKLRDGLETHRRRNEYLQASRRASQETRVHPSNQTTLLCEPLNQ